MALNSSLKLRIKIQCKHFFSMQRFKKREGVITVKQFSITDKQEALIVLPTLVDCYVFYISLSMMVGDFENLPIIYVSAN